jgi:hypothetical protein
MFSPQASAPALHERFKERPSAAWQRTGRQGPYHSSLLPFSFAQRRADFGQEDRVKPPRPS